jgi:hypothetical protein
MAYISLSDNIAYRYIITISAVNGAAGIFNRIYESVVGVIAHDK